MDIDSPPTLPDSNEPPSSHSHLNLPTFSSSFPLPFRVLFLVGLAQLLWALNLHILHLLGLDTAWILDFRDTSHETTEINLNDERRLPSPSGRPESGKLYQPVYKLFLVYTAWVGSGWVLFRWITEGEAESMEEWRWFVGIIAIGAAVGALAPWEGVGEKERKALRVYVLLRMINTGCMD